MRTMCSSSAARWRRSASRASRLRARFGRNARDEHHQQRRVQREADQHALHVQAGDAARRGRTAVAAGARTPPAGKQAGERDDGPGRPGLQQHRDRITCSRYRKTKGLVAPPLRYSCTVRLATSTSKARNSSPLVTGRCSCQRSMAGDVEGQQAGQHVQHRDERQADAEAECATAMVATWPTTAIQRSWISCCMFSGRWRRRRRRPCSRQTSVACSSFPAPGCRGAASASRPPTRPPPSAPGHTR